MGNRRITNCPNCGAALPVSGLKCEFCGTRVIDLTMIDFDSDEPTMYVFKVPTRLTPRIGDDTKPCYISTWAKPELVGIDHIYQTESVIAMSGSKKRYFPLPPRETLTFNLTLKAYENPDTHEMFKVCYEE